MKIDVDLWHIFMTHWNWVWILFFMARGANK